VAGLITASVVTGSSAGAVQRCFGQPATGVGNNGDNTIVGTPDRDVIVSLGGDDQIHGRGGPDLICAGDDHDTVEGEDGNGSTPGTGTTRSKGKWAPTESPWVPGVTT
jgi:hypothetical protein